MSKISLEPNDSGAGTFSIVSPDSNTNRTLNLPDEAGKLLSTGNDDPAEIFKQSNILGTVSESSGVPTGAIIERGSNANGEFVKYADGTLMMTQMIDGDATTDTENGTWTFPIALKDSNFFSNPGFAGVLCSSTQVGAGVRNSNTIISWSIPVRTNTDSAPYRVTFAGTESSQDRRLQFILIYRWY